ncbi:hypothetical protein C8R44DRAFT_894041 [Mycena epipterygia]|nr:hypothetical protein C8R44DRAFT_894041 [Mycena epipterygia]
MSFVTDTTKGATTLGRLDCGGHTAAEDMHVPPSPPARLRFYPPTEAPAHTPERPGQRSRMQVPKLKILRYLYKLLKNVHKELGISANAMSVLGRLLNKQATILACEIPTVVRVFPWELAKHVMVEGEKAMHNYGKAS